MVQATVLKSTETLLIQNFELGKLGILDVLYADLGGQLFHDPGQVAPGKVLCLEDLGQSSFVSTLSQKNVQRNFTQKGYAELLGLPAGASLAEQVNSL